MKKTHWMLALGGALVLAACGSSDSSSTPDSGTPVNNPPTIQISGAAYSPTAITVDAGAVITVKNLDSVPHTVTSEAHTGDFAPGAVAGVTFDSGNVAGGQSGSVTVPANAPSGTVIPFYCVVHGNMMGEGTITVH